MTALFIALMTLRLCQAAIDVGCDDGWTRDYTWACNNLCGCTEGELCDKCCKHDTDNELCYAKEPANVGCDGDWTRDYIWACNNLCGCRKGELCDMCCKYNEYDNMCYAKNPTIVTANVGKGNKRMDVEISATFRLEFDLYPLGTGVNWNNILHITADDEDLNWGSRIPGVWFHGDSTYLHVCAACDGNANTCVENPTPLPIGEWSRILVLVDSGKFTLFVDDVEVGSTACECPFTPKDLDLPPGAKASVYVGDPFYNAANARVQNIKYTPLGDYARRRIEGQTAAGEPKAAADHLLEPPLPLRQARSPTRRLAERLRRLQRIWKL